MPSRNHALVQKNLLVGLDSRYRKQYTFLSEITLEMPDKPNAVPDIAIYPRLVIDFLDDESSMKQVPLTAIEIASSSQSDDELIRKINRYLQAGVQSCWLVLPSMQAIAVYTEIGKYRFYSLGSTLIDEVCRIELPLEEVFSA